MTGLCFPPRHPPVIGVPQLGLDEEVLALDFASLEQLLQSLADLVLLKKVDKRG